jgi:acyl carrier protein
MNDEQINDLVVAALRQVAPEADPASLDPKADFRDQLDIDSMDFLSFVIALSEAVDWEIPERDYPRLSSLDASVEYLRARVPALSA